MKKNLSSKKSERGQALILIVMAMVGLLGLTGLAVDGGLAYSDRRNAQNAADTAAFAAARAMIRSEPWKGAGLFMAGENGYVDQDSTIGTTDDNVNVEVYLCNEPAATCTGIPVGQEDEYIQVRITSVINTTFARIVGISQLTNRVNALAKAKPGTIDPSMFGNAMVSLMCDCKGQSSNKNPFTLSGTGLNIVSGSGVFINSSCSSAFEQNGGGEITSESGICVVGGVSGSSNLAKVDPDPQTSCGTAYSCPPPMVFPNPSCDTNGNGTIDADEMGEIVEIGDKEYLASPGYYTSSNKDFPDAPGPAGKLIMQKGVYCIEEADFSLNSTWELTSDVNGNGQHDEYTEGVLIMTVKGGIKFNGSSSINIHAISDPNAPEDLRNLLLYIPPGNNSDLQVNGSSGSEYTGSIWAPSSHCSLQGGGGSLGLSSQIMCYSMEVTGNATLNITYDQNDNAIVKVPPSIELNK
jgi:Tfp pilus assembly protein PilX